MKVAGLCSEGPRALGLWRGLADLPGADLFLLVFGRSPIYDLRTLPWRDRPLYLRLRARGRLRVSRRDLHDPANLDWLRRLDADVGLHASGAIYRAASIDLFRRGILNPHIGLLPEYRGRSVMEWSLLEGSPTGVTVFFVDEGIDTGSRLVLRREAPLEPAPTPSGAAAPTGHAAPRVQAAKQSLFRLEVPLFREALSRLADPGFTPMRAEASGRRYYAMSALLTGAIEAHLARRAAQAAGGAAAGGAPRAALARTPAGS